VSPIAAQCNGFPCTVQKNADETGIFYGPEKSLGSFKGLRKRSPGACKTVYPGSIPGVASKSINGFGPSATASKPALPTRLIGQHIDGEAARELLVVPRRPLSAPLFANKLLRRAAEIASAATGRRRICRHRRGGRNAGILAVHSLRVAIDLTRERRRIYRRRCDGHRVHGLTGLSEKLGCKRDASHQHERR